MLQDDPNKRKNSKELIEIINKSSSKLKRNSCSDRKFGLGLLLDIKFIIWLHNPNFGCDIFAKYKVSIIIDTHISFLYVKRICLNISYFFRDLILLSNLHLLHL